MHTLTQKHKHQHSLDVERSFSKMRDVQTIKRNKLSNTSLNMYSVLYFNGDIEGHFDLY